MCTITGQSDASSPIHSKNAPDLSWIDDCAPDDDKAKKKRGKKPAGNPKPSKSQPGPSSKSQEAVQVAVESPASFVASENRRPAKVRKGGATTTSAPVAAVDMPVELALDSFLILLYHENFSF